MLWVHSRDLHTFAKVANAATYDFGEFWLLIRSSRTSTPAFEVYSYNSTPVSSLAQGGHTTIDSLADRTTIPKIGDLPLHRAHGIAPRSVTLSIFQFHFGLRRRSAMLHAL